MFPGGIPVPMGAVPGSMMMGGGYPNTGYAQYAGPMPMAAPYQQPMTGPVTYQSNGPVVTMNPASAPYGGAPAPDMGYPSGPPMQLYPTSGYAPVPAPVAAPTSWFPPAFTGVLDSIRIAPDGPAVLHALQVCGISARLHCIQSLRTVITPV